MRLIALTGLPLLASCAAMDDLSNARHTATQLQHSTANMHAITVGWLVHRSFP